MVPATHAAVALRPLLGRRDILRGVLWAVGIWDLLHVRCRRVARVVMDLCKSQQSRSVERNADADASVDHRGTIHHSGFSYCFRRYGISQSDKLRMLFDIMRVFVRRAVFVDLPATATFLTQEERSFVINRLSE